MFTCRVADSDKGHGDLTGVIHDKAVRTFGDNVWQFDEITRFPAVKCSASSNIFGLDWKDVGVLRRSKRSVWLASPLPRKNIVDGQNPAPVGTETIGN